MFTEYWSDKVPSGAQLHDLIMRSRGDWGKYHQQSFCIMVIAQGDTGHAEVDMITRVYAHILDEDRKINAQKFEYSFYSNPDLRKVRAPEETQPAVDVATLIQQLRN